MTTTTPLTPADIEGRKMVDAAHIDYTRGSSAWMGGVEGVPRLSIARGVERSKSFVRWYVDTKPVRDLDTALAVINGQKTLETAMAEMENADKRPARKISLTGQIQEVDYELAQREKVYGRLVGSGGMRQSQADEHTERMKAVRATLVWLQENELLIKQRMAE